MTFGSTRKLLKPNIWFSRGGRDREREREEERERERGCMREDCVRKENGRLGKLSIKKTSNKQYDWMV